MLQSEMKANTKIYAVCSVTCPSTAVQYVTYDEYVHRVSYTILNTQRMWLQLNILLHAMFPLILHETSVL